MGAALITGASSGVGEAVARRLAVEGHDVVLLARREARLARLAEELRSAHGVLVEAVACDLADRASRDRALAAVTAIGWDVEVLANCAGSGLTGPFHEHDLDDVTSMVAANFEGAVHLTGALVRPMIDRRRGQVLFLSSLAGAGPVPGFAAYAASKAALTSFAEALHTELRPLGVHVTVACLGPVTTEFGAIADLDALMDRTPASLTATAQEAADAALDGLRRHQRVVIPKAPVRILGVLGGHAPHAVSLRVWPKVFGIS